MPVSSLSARSSLDVRPDGRITVFKHSLKFFQPYTVDTLKIFSICSMYRAFKRERRMAKQQANDKKTDSKPETEATAQDKNDFKQDAQTSEAVTEEPSTDELSDRLLRTVAEMENLRKRHERDLSEMRRYAVTGFAQDMINVLENLRRAQASIPEEEIDKEGLYKQIYDGVTLTANELLKAFEKHGIKRIDPQGEKFDHNFHQAVSEVPTNDAEPGSIIDVLHAGYVIHDRLLRPAAVVVAKAIPGANETAQATPSSEAESTESNS